MNKLSEANAVRYINKIYKNTFKLLAPELKETDNWNTVVSSLDSHFTIEGLNEAVLFLDRINVIGAIMSLNHKSWLVENGKEIMDENDQCYFVVADKMLSGHESLFLCAAGIYNEGYESKLDANEIIKGWLKPTKDDTPCPVLISNSCILKDGTIFSIVAIQLSSSVRRFKKEEKEYETNN